MQFDDRLLKCSDCGNEFVFTAGEQIFFYDKQFKNDPKRCKLCKAKRAGLGRTASAHGATPLPFSRNGDTNVVFGVRDRDDGAFQTNPGTASAVPVMLPDEACAVRRGGGGESGLAGGAGCGGGCGAGWSDESGDGVGFSGGICGGDDGDDCRDARDADGGERRGGGARGKRSKGFVERVCRVMKMAARTGRL